MVPQPVWLERPVVELCDPNVKLEGPKPEPLPFIRNTSGRNWKQPHGATVRTQQSNKNGKGGSAWEKRQDSRKKDEAIKKLEREMKQEKADEAEAKRTALKERREKEAEKLRLQQLAEKMSAKRLQRMKKRLGRTKKISA